jgi:hypothetical protein
MAQVVELDAVGDAFRTQFHNALLGMKRQVVLTKRLIELNEQSMNGRRVRAQAQRLATAHYRLLRVALSAVLIGLLQKRSNTLFIWHIFVRAARVGRSRGYRREGASAVLAKATVVAVVDIASGTVHGFT